MKLANLRTAALRRGFVHVDVLESRRLLAAETVVLQPDRKSTRLNSSHTVIYTLSLHDALPIYETRQPSYRGAAPRLRARRRAGIPPAACRGNGRPPARSEEHTSELQSHSDLHSFPTRRSSDL